MIYLKNFEIASGTSVLRDVREAQSRYSGGVTTGVREKEGEADAKSISRRANAGFTGF